jgi:ribonuclease P protein component
MLPAFFAGPGILARRLVSTSTIRTLEQHHETHFSAQPPEARPQPRLPCPYGHRQRPQGHQGTPRQGPRPSDPSISAFLLAPGQGFPRAARLLRPAEFRRVFQQARRVQDGNFTILARANGGLPARLGLAIARKQIRRAVDRNRLKRLIRESFRHRQADLQGLDLVVMARSQARQRSNGELSDALARLWRSLCETPLK